MSERKEKRDQIPSGARPTWYKTDTGQHRKTGTYFVVSLPLPKLVERFLAILKDESHFDGLTLDSTITISNSQLAGRRFGLFLSYNSHSRDKQQTIFNLLFPTCDDKASEDAENSKIDLVSVNKWGDKLSRAMQLKINISSVNPTEETLAFLTQIDAFDRRLKALIRLKRERSGPPYSEEVKQERSKSPSKSKKKLTNEKKKTERNCAEEKEVETGMVTSGEDENDRKMISKSNNSEIKQTQLSDSGKRQARVSAGRIAKQVGVSHGTEKKPKLTEMLRTIESVRKEITSRRQTYEGLINRSEKWLKAFQEDTTFKHQKLSMISGGNLPQANIVFKEKGKFEEEVRLRKECEEQNKAKDTETELRKQIQDLKSYVKELEEKGGMVTRYSADIADNQNVKSNKEANTIEISDKGLREEQTEAITNDVTFFCSSQNEEAAGNLPQQINLHESKVLPRITEQELNEKIKALQNDNTRMIDIILNHKLEFTIMMNTIKALRNGKDELIRENQKLKEELGLVRRAYLSEM